MYHLFVKDSFFSEDILVLVRSTMLTFDCPKKQFYILKKVQGSKMFSKIRDLTMIFFRKKLPLIINSVLRKTVSSVLTIENQQKWYFVTKTVLSYCEKKLF